jgi:hypothetical protein
MLYPVGSESPTLIGLRALKRRSRAAASPGGRRTYQDSPCEAPGGHPGETVRRSNESGRFVPPVGGQLAEWVFLP